MNRMYLGKIAYDGIIYQIKVETDNSYSSATFYDNSNKIIAKLVPPYDIMLTNAYRDLPPQFLSQIDSLWKDLKESNLSMEDRNTILDETSSQLQIEPGDIIQFSIADLSQIVREREHSDDSEEKVRDKNDENAINDNKFNKDEKKPLTTKDIGIREETPLDRRVDDRYTLGTILGISESGASLVCVETSNIPNSKNPYRFSFLVKHRDGTLEEASMLEPHPGLGTIPREDVYGSNRDGSVVSKDKVLSAYRIKDSAGKNKALFVSYDKAGTLKLSLGKTNIEQGLDYVTVPLETDHQRFTTHEVQDLIDRGLGIHRPSSELNEAEAHPEGEYDNGEVKKEDIDGDPNTGHQHLDRTHLLMIASNILNKNPELEEFYSIDGLSKELEVYINKNPDKPLNNAIEDFTDDAVEDCSHFKSKNI